MVISASLQAWGVVFPFAMLTSICRSIVTICSGLYLLMGMTRFSSKWILSHSTWHKFCRSRHLLGLTVKADMPFFAIDAISYFCKHGNMQQARRATSHPSPVVQYADMFAAIGNEARLRILQLLLKAHPDGLVVGEIQAELQIPNSTLSHHLDKLKNESLVLMRRESTFLRYTANAEALQN